MSSRKLSLLVLLLLIPLLVITIGQAAGGEMLFLPIIFNEVGQEPPPRNTPTPTSVETATAIPPTATTTPTEVPPTATATNTQVPPTPTETSVPPTPTETSVPPTPTNTATPTIAPCDYVCITYIENNPVNEDDLETEYVVIENFTDQPVDMTDWLLSDSDHWYYSFDFFTLQPGESVRLWTKDGLDTQTDIYWGLQWPVWNLDHDCATLFDQYNQFIDEYCY